MKMPRLTRRQRNLVHCAPFNEARIVDRAMRSAVFRVRKADEFNHQLEFIGATGLVLSSVLGVGAAYLGGAVDIITELIRQGQQAGRYRMDMDVTVKAVQILAFITGMETTWLINPSIPLTEVFKDYAESLARDMAPPSSG